MLAQSISLVAPYRSRCRRAPSEPSPSTELQGVIDTTTQWLQRPGRQVVTLADDGYPPLLLHDGRSARHAVYRRPGQPVPCPRLALLAPDGASKDAIDTAVAFARELSAAGIALLVNFGYRRSARQCCNALLATPGADVMAVLDSGPDRISPAAHIELARKIAEQGALVTEFAPGERAPCGRAAHAPLLMAGLPSAVLVFEAGLASSGTGYRPAGRRVGQGCVRTARLDPRAACPRLPSADSGRRPPG